jgi:hypothetical protein
VRCVPRLAPNTALYSKRNKTSQRQRSPALPYELIRRTGERAVADGKATLASTRSLPIAKAILPNHFSSHVCERRLSSRKARRHVKPSGRPSAVPDLRRCFSRPDMRYFRKEQNIYAPAISRGHFELSGGGPCSKTPAARPIRLCRFICRGHHARRGVPRRIEPVQPRQRTRAATIDTMAAALAAGQ